MRLDIAQNIRDLALFDLAIDSKLRGWDLVKMLVADVYAAGQVKERASISTRQYAWLVREWVTSIDLEPSTNGTFDPVRMSQFAIEDMWTLSAGNWEAMAA